MSRTVWSLDVIEARARAMGATTSFESGEFHKRWLYIRITSGSIESCVSAFEDGRHMFDVKVFGDAPIGLVASAKAIESFWQELVDGLPGEPSVVVPVPSEPEVQF